MDRLVAGSPHASQAVIVGEHRVAPRFETSVTAELFVPVLGDGVCRGMIDLDSPVDGRFDRRDQAGIESLASTVVDASDWSGRP